MLRLNCARFDKEKLSARRDRVSPFDVERDFARPAGVGAGEIGAAVLIDHGEARRRSDGLR